MTISIHIDKPCKVCGEGTLQARESILNLHHNGVPISLCVDIPSCNACGASIMPRSLKSDIKAKKAEAYAAIVASTSLYNQSKMYVIKVSALCGNTFKEKISEIDPLRQIEGIDGKFLNITYADLIQSFSNVLQSISGHNFTIHNRAFIASQIIDDLKVNGLIDAALLYEQVHSFVPNELATHIDYMTIIPAELME